MINRTALQKYAWLSVAAALVTIALKSWAYSITGSVGLLSDALESSINLLGALFALAMLKFASDPPDEKHPYGHTKAEYFAGAFEGILVFVAGLSIAWAAVQRMQQPHPLEQIGLGLVITLAATLVNLGVGQTLIGISRKRNSIALEADGRHLMTDVWTSAAVIAGVGLVALTGWQVLDPLVALAVAANILWVGFKLLRVSVYGLMDTALPPDELEKLQSTLTQFESEGVKFHALRSRQAAGRRFVSMHVLVPDSWSVTQGHKFVERVEGKVRSELPNTTVFTHLEPLGDPASFEDLTLDR